MRRTARGLAYRAVRNRGTLGGSLAHADPVAEWPNVLTALNAVILLRSIDGMRSVPIREFLIGYLTTGLEPGEILVGVEIPRPARSQRAGISKLCRKAGEFAHSLAVTVIQDSQPARCVLGCAASTPILLTRVGALEIGRAPCGERVRPSG